MKTFRFLGLLGLVMVCLMGFTACSSDDDDEGGSGSGKSQLTLNGKNYSLGYGYWSVVDYNQSTGRGHYVIDYFNYNLSGRTPSEIHFFSVDFYADGTAGEIPVGTYAPGDINISGALGVSMAKPEGDIYFEEASSNQASLEITKSGNTYTISLKDATFAVGESETAPGSFSFTGTLSPIPEGF